jgi:outer membrane protein insertion porin family
MTKRRKLFKCALSIVFVSIVALVSVRATLAQQPPAGAPTAATDTLVEDVEIRGNRRIPRDTVLYYIQTKPGDKYSPDVAKRDLESILAQGWFDPLKTKLLADDGPKGGKVIIFQVSEYPIIRDLQYHNLKSATESDVLTRFKERRVQVSKESQFDPSKVTAARNVLRELLAEKGHPDAQVGIEVEEISATTIALIFNVEEGPRVRIKEIQFVGDSDGFSQKRLRGAMKLVKEAGLFTSFTDKDIYFKDKLQDDLERVRFFLGTKGYLQAKIGEPKIERAGEVKGGIPLPGLQKKGPGLTVTIPVEIGRRYTITDVVEKGVTLFPPGAITAVAGLKKGEIASAKALQEGVYKNVKDLYGSRGYIQASVDVQPKFTDKTAEEGDVEFTLEVDEGKQFSLRRLEFIGNSNTRDRVLRREVLINEGDPYSKQLWDYSILRLNQLGLFDEIKEKDAITRTDDRNQTVDIDLQVKEKGRQQIQLNGGVSGIGGSFFGISYSTNNLLGYGENLTFDVTAGNRQIYFLIGITEPYFLGRPISLGVQFFAQSYKFVGSGYYFGNAASYNNLVQASLFGLSSVDASTLFTQRTWGGTISSTAPLQMFTRKWPKISGFTRIGLSYSLTNTRVKDPSVNTDADPNNNIPVTYSQPAILTSRIQPTITYNTLNATIDPTRGQSLFLGFGLSGGILGGDVNTFSPTLEYKYFRPMRKKKEEHPQVLGMRFLAAHIRSFGTPIDTQSLAYIGGTPIYERFFLGGENDIRGYNVRSLSPVVPLDRYLSTRNVTAQVLDSSGNMVAAPAGSVSPSALRNLTYDAPEGACTITPSANCNVVKSTTFYSPIGGDTELLYNVEYRVPIFGPLSVAAFADVGTAFNLRSYNDQIVKTNFVNQCLVFDALGNCTTTALNPAGRIATVGELQSAPTDATGKPVGFRDVFFHGDSQTYDIAHISQKGVGGLYDRLVASLGMEVRVQVPMINVPFRLIFAYNPKARTDVNDPTVFYRERKAVVRFSIGRTF